MFTNLIILINSDLISSGKTKFSMASCTIIVWLKKSDLLFQDWRKGVLGAVNTEAVRLLNRIEEKWFTKKMFDNQFNMCDQLAMAVLLKPEVASKTERYSVS